MSGFLADARNDIACHAERSEASMSGFLADARNDIACHAERSEASMSGFLTGVRNDIFALVMLSAANNRECTRNCEKERMATQKK